MAAYSETQINLKTLQRVDSHIIEIIDNASQVAIYKYESKLEKWEGTDIEGTLFLYRRSLYPYHGFIIVNRMSTTNFIESITSDMQFQLQEPYLLYKNHGGEIIGSWFYESKDLQRISKQIQTIVLKQGSTSRRQRCASESETHLPKEDTKVQDIMTLLSKAHKEYVKKSTSQTATTDIHQKDVNNLISHSLEKKSFDKSMSSYGKKFKDSALRSSSQENYPVSPRRRFLSTGSFDPDRAKALYTIPYETIVKIQNTKIADSVNTQTSAKKTSACKSEFFSQGDRVAPTRLSPLFSHNEIMSPISDIGLLDQSDELQLPEPPFSDYWKSQNQSEDADAKLDWKKSIGSNCDKHFMSMKQVLKSQIQDNPKVMIKIHEAYVSSLRSIFTKN